MSFYKELRPEGKIRSFFTSKKQNEIECFHVDGYCDHCKTMFEAWLATITSAHAKKGEIGGEKWIC